MSSLPCEESLKIAESLRYPTHPFINGVYKATGNGYTFDSINPAPGQVIVTIEACSASDVDDAVAAAKGAFESGVWAGIHRFERKVILLRFAELISDNLHELAVMESLDASKPITDCLAVDVPETANSIIWHAETQDKLFSKIAPIDSNTVGLVLRERLGVAGIVLPWNFSMLMAAWKLGSALETGNSVVLKPAQMTTLTAPRKAELAIEVDIPAGVLNVVTGSGSVVGEAIGMYPEVRIISFTGSTEVGHMFLDYSRRSNLKRIVLELGGKNPAVVLDDAPDFDFVAEQRAFSILIIMDQNCASNSRLIVHKDIKKTLVEKIVAACKGWKLGDPLDVETQIGPVVGSGHCNNVKSHIEKGMAEGVTLVCGGSQLDCDGYFIKATVFDDVTPEMTIYHEEIFSPVLTVIEARDDDHAIELASDTDYGLTASLYTTDLGKAHKLRAPDQCRYGVGELLFRRRDVDALRRLHAIESGGRDNGLEAHEQYTKVKINQTPPVTKGAADEICARG